jgi:hypothetical protein
MRKETFFKYFSLTLKSHFPNVAAEMRDANNDLGAILSRKDPEKGP